jgi:hypothetical protein
MPTTFEKFIDNDPVEKAKFEKEYSDFLLQESIVETMIEEDFMVGTHPMVQAIDPESIAYCQKNP